MLLSPVLVATAGSSTAEGLSGVTGSVGGVTGVSGSSGTVGFSVIFVIEILTTVLLPAISNTSTLMSVFFANVFLYVLSSTFVKPSIACTFSLAVSVTSTASYVISFVLYVTLTSGAVLSILVTSTVTTVLFPALS